MRPRHVLSRLFARFVMAMGTFVLIQQAPAQVAVPIPAVIEPPLPRRAEACAGAAGVRAVRGMDRPVPMLFTPGGIRVTDPQKWKDRP